MKSISGKLYKRVTNVVFAFILTLSSVASLGSLFFTQPANAIDSSVFPSTNSQNILNNWANVQQEGATTSSVTLKFTSARPFASCFEYRTDGNTGQVSGSPNYNTGIMDGLYPFYCQSNNSSTKTISANSYVEVRMSFGAEGGERFDWTRFSVLDTSATQFVNSPKYVRANNSGDLVAQIVTPDTTTGVRFFVDGDTSTPIGGSNIGGAGATTSWWRLYTALPAGEHIITGEIEVYGNWYLITGSGTVYSLDLPWAQYVIPQTGQFFRPNDKVVRIKADDEFNQFNYMKTTINSATYTINRIDCSDQGSYVLCDLQNLSLPEGSYTAITTTHTQATNRVDNLVSQLFVIDDTRPTLANFQITSVHTVYSHSIAVSADATDANGIDNVTFYVTSPRASDGLCDGNGAQLTSIRGALVSGSTYAATIDTSSLQGEYCLNAIAADVAANHSSQILHMKVTVDNTAPTATLIFATPSPSATGFKVQFSEAVNVVDAENPANYSLYNWPGAGGSGTLSGHAVVSYDAATTTATVKFTTPGWSISAEQQWGVENIHDLAGNLLALNPTKDYSTPMEDPTTPGTPTATTPTNNKTVTWSWSPATDPGGVNASGVKGYYYTLTSGATTVIGSIFTSNPTATTTVPADGTYTLTVYTIDKAGNVSGTVSGQVVVDTIAPVVTVDASANTANNKPTITGTIDDHTATVSLDIDGMPFVATNNGDGTWIYTVTTALTDGTHILTATGTDTADNTTTPVATGSILVDTTGPAVTIADITAPITTGSVTPTVTATDVSAPLTYLWTANPTNPAVISFTNNIAQPIFTPTIAGTYSFTLLTTDALGNSTTKTFEFTYTPPVVTPNGTTPGAIVVTPQPTNNNLGAPAVLGAQTAAATTDTTQTPAADALGTPAVKGASDQLATTTPSSSSTGLAWYWWLAILAALAAGWWAITAYRHSHDNEA